MVKSPAKQTFPAQTGNPVYFSKYSRFLGGTRENWQDTCIRVVDGLREIGKLTDDEVALIYRNMRSLKAIPAGRLLWVGGTEWFKQPDNFYGGYNCNSTNVTNWKAFELLMDLAMQGCGTGACIEPECINQLPPICNTINASIVGLPGEGERSGEETTLIFDGTKARLAVGDSRQGWTSSLRSLLELASNPSFPRVIQLEVDLSGVRPKGSKLQGFGGVANPSKLPQLYPRVAAILNKAVGRQLNSVECALIIGEAAVVVVAGNIRRSAQIMQGSSNDSVFAIAKDDLWQVDSQGNWRIDPERDALRMANHTRVFHYKPSREECVESVRKQYRSGEGAIQWAGELVARCNRDLLDTYERKQEFLNRYVGGTNDAAFYLAQLYSLRCGDFISNSELHHRMSRYKLNPCGEIGGDSFFCDLAEIHLNRIDPLNLEEQESAFKAAAIAVSTLLHHKFTEPRYQASREFDPIVGVSFTGLFDFFVNVFGLPYLQWWKAGRSRKWGEYIVGNLDSTGNFCIDQVGDHLLCKGEYFLKVEGQFLTRWRQIVEKTVWDYCDRHSLKRPNRCTTVQPSGTKALLTGASPGWHPPKSQRYIRRITFAVNDPVALACIDYGYNVIPAQSDKDENGNLLTNPFDPRCTEWLVEIPVEVPWANLPGAEEIDVDQFSALAQFDFYMQVQTHYTRHNTSATLELREDEVEGLANRLYQAIQDDEGYVSATIFSRTDAPFPRKPYEPIDKATYDQLQGEVLQRRKIEDFSEALARYDQGEQFGSAPAGCDSDKCLSPVSTERFPLIIKE